MSDEVELKFDVEPASVARLRAAPALAAAVAHGEESESLYFDARDGALRAAGISLRVRRAGGRNVQTVKRKRGDAAGLFVREEWEAEVPRFKLDLAAFRAAPARRLLGKVDGEALKAVVRTRFTRTAWHVVRENSRIEVVLDEGFVAAGGRKTALCELELELKQGKSSALFALAEELGRAAPLRLGAMSKNERGYALAEGRLGRAAKAEPVRIDPAATEAQAFGAIAFACLRQFRFNEIALLEGRDSEALHQARVALRRLRSAMTLFRPALRGTDYQKLRDELRWFAAQFGDARNCDILLGEDAPPPFADDVRLRARVEKERDRAYRRVARALNSARARALMLRFALWLELGGWRTRPRAAGAVRELAARQLERQWRKVRRRGGALGTLDAEAEHQLRIDIKKLRYSSEFLAGVFAVQPLAGRRARFIAALKELQERLGVANDARLAASVAARLAPGREMPAAPQISIKAAQKAFRRTSAAAGYWEIAA